MLLKKAIAINPGYADAHLNIAAAYERTGDAQNALAHYKLYLDGGNTPELSGDMETKTDVREKISALTNALSLK